MASPEAPSPPTTPPAGRAGLVVTVGLVLAAAVGVGLLLLAAALAAGLVPNVAKPDYNRGLTAGDLGSLVVAGASLLLADFTALLAWITRRSIGATQREAAIAERALAASNRQAEVADKALAAAQRQAEIAERQVTATNEQARAAQEQLAAGLRPMLVEPRQRVFVDSPTTMERPFAFEVTLVNIGPGPAFVAKGLLSLGAATTAADNIKPRIIESGAHTRLTFVLRPPENGVDQTIARAMVSGSEVTIGALYHDISGQRAWRSRGRLTQRGTDQWELVDVDVADIELTFLD